MKNLILPITLAIVLSLGLVNAYDFYEDVDMNGNNINNVEQIYNEEGIMTSDLYVDGNCDVDGELVVYETSWYGGHLLPIGWGVINLGSQEQAFNEIYSLYQYRYDWGTHQWLRCFYYYGREYCR